MAEVQIIESGMQATLYNAAYDAMDIVAGRVTELGKTLTRDLSTRPPGRREWPYSLPRGRLRESITYEISLTHGPLPVGLVGVTKRGLPLANFRNIGGQGRPAYGTRGNNPSLWEATLAQIGVPIP